MVISGDVIGGERVVMEVRRRLVNEEGDEKGKGGREGGREGMVSPHHLL